MGDSAHHAPVSCGVLDNASFHKNPELYTFLKDKYGAKMELLPPYYPVYNPIEKLFGTMKRHLHLNHQRFAPMPALDAVRLALEECATPDHCNKWIRSIEVYGR